MNAVSERTAKIIRIITVAPFNALIMSSLIFFNSQTLTLKTYMTLIVFLTFFPLSAYPLQPAVPFFKDKGREGQRNFAIVMSVAGYLLGLFFALLFKEPNFTVAVYLTYLLSGTTIALFGKLFNFKASGHACGLCGPIAILFYVFGIRALLGAILIPIVFWASLKLKRHTLLQLFGGAVIPVFIFCLLALILV